MLEARAEVQRMSPYRPPVAGRRGLRLDFNESTVGCSPRVLARLQQLGPEDLARYPDREPVEAAVAGLVSVRPDELLLTNGADEAIHLLCEVYLQSGDEVLLPVPTFGMYRVYAEATGAKVMAVAAKAGFHFPLERLLEGITSRTRLIAIANPNNPTGRVATRDQLLRVLDAAPDAAVLIDEAYFDFHGETLLGEVGRRPNLFIARTFSKAYGLAGLRLGMLAGDARQMQMVRKMATPYNVNSLALACAEEALRDLAHVEQYVRQVQRSRIHLERLLKGLGVRYTPSEANFVLIDIGPRHREFVEHMRSRQVLVRDRSADPGCEGWVRITLGREEHMSPLFTALEEWMRCDLAQMGARI